MKYILPYLFLASFLTGNSLAETKSVPAKQKSEINQILPLLIARFRLYLITKEIVEVSHKNGIKVITLVTENKECIEKVISCGADYILSNYPEKVIEY